MTLFRNPLMATQAILIALVPCSFVAFAFPIFELTSNDRWVNNVSGAVALLGAALALCRVWSDETNQRAGLFWLVASIGFSIVAISQWYEHRLEAVERALRMEDVDDVLLLLMMPPIVLIGIRTKGVSLVVKAILLIGFLTQTVSTGMDILNDWVTSLPEGARTTEMAVNYSELVFLQLYVIAFALFVVADLADRRQDRTDDPLPRARLPGQTDTP
jgi:hypothetical protein